MNKGVSLAIMAGLALMNPQCASRHEVGSDQRHWTRAHGLPIQPQTPRGQDVDVVGQTRAQDPYRWLERANDPATSSWTDWQDLAARKFLDGLPNRDKIRQRIADLAQAGTIGPLRHFGGAYFQLRRDANEQREKIVVRTKLDGPFRVIVDSNAWPDRTLAIRDFWPSPDGRKLVYGISEKGSTSLVFRIRDIASADESEIISHIEDSDASWSHDSSGFYYRWTPSVEGVAAPELPAYAEVRFHRLGTSPKDDKTIRSKTGDARITEYPSVTDDGRWLLLHVQRGFSQMEVLYRSLSATDSSWNRLKTQPESWTEATNDGHLLFLKTTDGASKGRVIRVDLAHPERANWVEVVPERRDAVLRTLHVAGHRLILEWQKDAQTFIESCSEDGKGCISANLPAPGTISAISAKSEDDALSVLFSSYTIPPTLLSISATTGKVIPTEQVLAPLNPEAYFVQRTDFVSKDGTRIPLFLAGRRDLNKTGAIPTLYTAYGGFGESVTPGYFSEIVAWLDAGGLFAEAAVRGGGEYGEDWHRAGMLGKKQNVIDDYLAGARHLQMTGWTNSSSIIAYGTSNGGLLVGAAITQQPTAFGAAVMRSALIDMARFHRSGNGGQWTPEYGDPAREEDLRFLLGYSPYHNVRKGEPYPPTLTAISVNDDLVEPMHGKKFTASLQWAGSRGPALLRAYPNSGHMGAAEVRQRSEMYADFFSFSLAMVARPPH